LGREKHGYKGGVIYDGNRGWEGGKEGRGEARKLFRASWRVKGGEDIGCYALVIVLLGLEPCCPLEYIGYLL
jgi:hypothetical protein